MERAGLNAHGPLMAAVYILFISILIVTVIIIIPIAGMCYFLPLRTSPPQITSETIQPEEFDGW